MTKEETAWMLAISGLPGRFLEMPAEGSATTRDTEGACTWPFHCCTDGFPVRKPTDSSRCATASNCGLSGPLGEAAPASEGTRFMCAKPVETIKHHSERGQNAWLQRSRPGAVSCALAGALDTNSIQARLARQRLVIVLGLKRVRSYVRVVALPPSSPTPCSRGGGRRLGSFVVLHEPLRSLPVECHERPLFPPLVRGMDRTPSF
jgi:hypothetical protein